MSTAYVETDYAWVRLHQGRLAVFSKRDDDHSDDLLQEIPLEGLEQLCLREHVQITAEALCTLLRTSVPVHYLDRKDDLLGTCLAPAAAESATRLRQYELARDDAFALRTAAALIEAKITNQARLLQRLAANRPEIPTPPIQPLLTLRAEATRAGDPSALLGVEGSAAAIHYALWSCYLPPEFPFERRSTRPPHNPVNACLSYTATLLYHDFVSALHQRGLDPGLGILHVTENGRWSLALDLMEPFRPVLCDALTVHLLGHRILRPEHFEPHGEDGVYLTKEGRHELISHYEQRLDRSFLSEQLQHRTTLRQAITDNVLALKAALTQDRPFQPFRLN